MKTNVALVFMVLCCGCVSFSAASASQKANNAPSLIPGDISVYFSNMLNEEDSPWRGGPEFQAHARAALRSSDELFSEVVATRLSLTPVGAPTRLPVDFEIRGVRALVVLCDRFDDSRCEQFAITSSRVIWLDGKLWWKPKEDPSAALFDSLMSLMSLQSAN